MRSLNTWGIGGFERGVVGWRKAATLWRREIGALKVRRGGRRQGKGWRFGRLGGWIIIIIIIIFDDNVGGNHD